ncbi:hypothetical protein KY333_01145 [Candidatus Woesearchaeota archaeon]|nr:hypothetical protein [Candidatus Woesearchaeota archaeon]MBW2994143.1 hypothetical protein [Candidatus Woesearchaeota archaeon]
MEKGQAAIEFMLTYGWILLVVVVAMGALLYFGFLSPETFNQKQCEIAPGIDCIEFRATSDELTLIIENNLGQDIFIKKMNDPLGECSFEEGKEVKTSEKETFLLQNCNYDSKGESLKTEVVIEYQSSTGIDHTETAQILTFIE